MPTVTPSDISCGAYQLFGLSADSRTLLRTVMAAYKGQARSMGRRNGFAQVIFSDNHYLRNGHRFAEYLTRTFPTSQLVELKAKRSPSTQNDITTWIWNIPHPRFKKHALYAQAASRRPRREGDWL